jgi:elongation factor Tu
MSFVDGPDANTPFSMKIEDVFSTGRGTVVTGRIDSGSIKSTEEVIIIGGAQNRKAHVTGIEKFNGVVNEAKIGDEVGLLLYGISKDSVHKGYIVAKETFGGFNRQ